MTNNAMLFKKMVLNDTFPVFQKFQLAPMHYALSRDMTHVSWRMQTTGGKGLRPVDRYMMYTDIAFENHSQLLTTFNLTVKQQYSLHVLGEEISTAGPIHIHSRELLKFHAFHGTVKLEFTIE